MLNLKRKIDVSIAEQIVLYVLIIAQRVVLRNNRFPTFELLYSFHGVLSFNFLYFFLFLFFHSSQFPHFSGKKIEKIGLEQKNYVNIRQKIAKAGKFPHMQTWLIGSFLV